MPVPVTTWRAAELSQPCDRAAFFFSRRGAADSHSRRVPASVTWNFGLCNVQPSPSFGESEEVEVPISFLGCIFPRYLILCLLLPATRITRRRTQISSAQRDQGPFSIAFGAERHHARLDLRSRSTDASTKANLARLFFFFS